MPIRKFKKREGPALVFITTTCVNWAPIFSDEKAASLAVAQLAETASIMSVAIVAYVIMPSHIHTMLGFKDMKSMPDFVRNFKSLSSRKIKENGISTTGVPILGDKAFQLWKRRYDDLIITSEKQLRIKLDYIHNNPVKAGLVKSAIEWKFSSARDWLTNEKGLIPVDKTFLFS
jgi:putative transposase